MEVTIAPPVLRNGLAQRKSGMPQPNASVTKGLFRLARVNRAFVCNFASGQPTNDAGAKARDLCRKFGVSEHTFYRANRLSRTGW